MNTSPWTPEERHVHETWASIQREHNAEFIIAGLITALAFAVGIIVGGYIETLGWGLRPAWIVGVLAGIASWLLLVALTAAMLASRDGSRPK